MGLRYGQSDNAHPAFVKWFFHELDNTALQRVWSFNQPCNPGS